MRLLTHDVNGAPRAGFVCGEHVVDLATALPLALRRSKAAVPRGLVESLAAADLGELIALGEIGLAALRTAAEDEHVAAEASAIGTPLADVAWRAPVARPSKIYCVFANNRFFAETADYLPDWPLYFQKPPSSLIGHLEAIELPDVGIVAPEPELAVVIGRTARHVSEADAYRHVFGYSVFNDVTAHDIRKADTAREQMIVRDDATGTQRMEPAITTPMSRHKGIDTFGPMGPWLVTRDELPDPHALEVEARLGDRVINRDHTSQLRFTVPQVIAHMSRWHTLLPGDVVTMGTASSTDDWPMMAADLSRYPDPVSIRIEGIGELVNPTVKTGASR